MSADTRAAIDTVRKYEKSQRQKHLTSRAATDHRSRLEQIKDRFNPRVTATEEAGQMHVEFRSRSRSQDAQQQNQTVFSDPTHGPGFSHGAGKSSEFQIRPPPVHMTPRQTIPENVLRYPNPQHSGMPHMSTQQVPSPWQALPSQTQDSLQMPQYQQVPNPFQFHFQQTPPDSQVLPQAAYLSPGFQGGPFFNIHITHLKGIKAILVFKDTQTIQDIKDFRLLLCTILEAIPDTILEVLLHPILEVTLQSTLEVILYPILEAIPDPTLEAVLDLITEVILDPILEIIRLQILEVIWHPILEVFLNPTFKAIWHPILDQGSDQILE
jgi:hypothetical protein